MRWADNGYSGPQLNRPALCRKVDDCRLRLTRKACGLSVRIRGTKNLFIFASRLRVFHRRSTAAFGRPDRCPELVSGTADRSSVAVECGVVAESWEEWDYRLFTNDRRRSRIGRPFRRMAPLMRRTPNHRIALPRLRLASRSSSSPICSPAAQLTIANDS